MQPINQNRSQQHVIPVEKRISGYGEPNSYTVITPARRDKFILPDDVVSLSTGSPPILNSSVNKKPSLPVTQAEKKALRDSFSVYV